MSLIQGTSKAAGGGYEIDQSIRFNDNDSAFLARTPSASNRKTWTWSAWVKRADLFNGSVPQILLSAGDGGTNDFIMQFGQSDDTLRISDYISSTQSNLITTQLFSDVGAWYHFVLAYDTTQGTEANRIKLYLNGSQVTAFGTAVYPSLNADLVINSAIPHNIGRGAYSSNGYFDGYQAEINFIDGTALDASSFGKTNDDGVWVPKKYTGSYGSNGFYLTGETAGDLGEDFSGNNNDFTSSGLATTDQMSDTPTNNHCTFNPLWIDTYTLSDGNLVTSTGPDAAALGTMAVDATDSDGWYWEMKVTTAATYPGVGIVLASYTSQIGATSLSGVETNRYYYEGWSGNFNNQGSTSAYGSTWSGTANKVIGVYLKGGALWFSIDGVVQNSGDPSTASTGAAITGLTGDFYPIVLYPAGSGTQAAWTAQFAEADWGTTPPTGYKALSTANLPTPSIKDGSAHFQPTLYEGNGSTQSINQAGNSTFQPDWVWIKNRDAADQHALFDVVRGATELMGTNVATAEATNDDTLTAFESDGFALGDDVIVNTNNESYVGWQWKANGSGSSNEDGSINTTATSANTTAGFSVSTYTGNATVGATVGHGLGMAPKVVIVKSRSNVESWVFGHDSVGWTKAMYMQSTGTPFALDIYWNNTAPTSSVVELHDHVVTNGSGATYVMYSFAEIPGYSSFGSYTGNGSTDGPMIWTGFKPAFVLFKNISASSQSWEMFDNKRDGINDSNRRLYPNSNAAEEAASDRVRFLSNGFKIVTSGGSHVNGSGNTIVYMAFAEHPFGGDGVAPVTAR